MKLPEVLLLAGAGAFVIIGIHQTLILGFEKAYWAFMLVCILIFVYTLAKKK